MQRDEWLIWRIKHRLRGKLEENMKWWVRRNKGENILENVKEERKENRDNLEYNRKIGKLYKRMINNIDMLLLMERIRKNKFYYNVQYK